MTAMCARLDTAHVAARPALMPFATLVRAAAPIVSVQATCAPKAYACAQKAHGETPANARAAMPRAISDATVRQMLTVTPAPPGTTRAAASLVSTHCAGLAIAATTMASALQTSAHRKVCAPVLSARTPPVNPAWTVTKHARVGARTAPRTLALHVLMVSVTAMAPARVLLPFASKAKTANRTLTAVACCCVALTEPALFRHAKAQRPTIVVQDAKQRLAQLASNAKATPTAPATIRTVTLASALYAIPHVLGAALEERQASALPVLMGTTTTVEPAPLARCATRTTSMTRRLAVPGAQARWTAFAGLVTFHAPVDAAVRGRQTVNLAQLAITIASLAVAAPRICVRKQAPAPATPTASPCSCVTTT